jgi:hypothetical protein
MNFLNRLQSLSPIYKAMIVLFGLALIVWGIFDLGVGISSIIHQFL